MGLEDVGNTPVAEEVVEPVVETPAEETSVVEEKVEQPANNAQEEIALFKKIAGGIPEGMDIVMHAGKPHLVGKVNGRQVVKSLDTIIRDFSMTEAAEEKLEAAKAQEKSLKEKQHIAEEMVKTLVNDPNQYWEILRAAGYKDEQINEIAAKQLELAIKDAETPKEVKELEKIKRENETLKAKMAERDALTERVRLEQETLKQVSAIKNDVFKALEDNKVFDKDVPELLRTNVLYAALHWMKVAEDQGIKEFTPDKAVKKAMKDMESWGKNYYNSLSDEMLVKMLPEKVAKVYANSVGRVKTVTPTANSISSNAKGSEPSTKKKSKDSINEFFSKL